MKGLLITFEGGEGTGKGTAAKKLLALLKAEGHDAVIYREPGTVEISEEIREVVQKPRENVNFSSFAELLLYSASRAQFVEELLKPSLEQGKIVLLDRYYDSTTAYQGYGRGLDLDFIQELSMRAVQNIVPHLTFIFDVSPEVGLKRCKKGEFGDERGDRIEQEEIDFHKKLRDGYLKMAKEHSRFKVVDAENNNQDQVFEIVKKIAMLAVNSGLRKNLNTARKVKN